MKYLDEVDRIVFLGDYLDPYPSEGIETDPSKIVQNLKEIIELKLNHMEKVVLLKGNHDQHYASKRFRKLAAGTRMDKLHWDEYHGIFTKNRELFKIVHLEEIKGIPYLFSHAGVTIHWLNKVNLFVWHLADDEISLADQEIVDKINALDNRGNGQNMLSIIGSSRSWYSVEKSGSVLWAGIDEHSIPEAPDKYGLNLVFQVFGHTRLKDNCDKLELSNLAMIDSRQCFIIDDIIDRKIMTVREYEQLKKPKCV